MRNKRPLYALAAIFVLFLGVAGFLYIARMSQMHFESNFPFLVQVGLLSISVTSMLCAIAALYSKHNIEQDLIAMKSDFISVASHEIRSPLGAVRWMLAELRADASLSPPARETVNEVYKRVCSLIELTGTFLQATSVDHGVMRPTDLQIIDIGPVVREAIARAQGIALPKRISVRTNVVIENKILMRADGERLKLVFDNLLSNAIKYSPDGALVSLSFEDRGSKKLFTVHDQGIGIPQEDLKDVFKGFHRAKNAKRPGTPGSGFGLYMVKKIVEFHRGTITVQSKINEGTTFFVTLPAGV